MSVLRKFGAAVMTNHWFCTIATIVYVSAFIASLFGVLTPFTVPGAWVMSPWFLGAAAVMFFAAAVAAWRDRWAIPPFSSDYWEEMRQRRLADITRWLRKPMTVNEAPPEARPVLNEWLQSVALPGDEVWFYDNGEDAWNALGGENGFALLRGGSVVEFMMWTMS